MVSEEVIAKEREEASSVVSMANSAGWAVMKSWIEKRIKQLDANVYNSQVVDNNLIMNISQVNAYKSLLKKIEEYTIIFNKGGKL